MEERLMFFLDRNAKNILNSFNYHTAHQNTFFAYGYANCLAELGTITQSQLAKERILYARACSERLLELVNEK